MVHPHTYFTVRDDVYAFVEKPQAEHSSVMERKLVEVGWRPVFEECLEAGRLVEKPSPQRSRPKG